MMFFSSPSNIAKRIIMAFLLPASIVFAQSSVREDPMLSEYRALERLSETDDDRAPAPRRVETVSAPERRNESMMDPPDITSKGPEPSATPLPLHMNPNAPEPWESAPAESSLDRSEIPDTPPVMLNPRLPDESGMMPNPLVNASPTERIPVASVLMIESESRTVSPDVLSVLTQVVWNEFQRSRHTRLQRLRYTRHVLSQFDLTPSDPYKVPPSPQKIAQVLNADYLVMGTAEEIENINLLELFLFDASANRIVASRAARSSQGYENLLQQIPEMVRDLQKSVPSVKSGSTRQSMAPGELSPRWIDQDVQARLRALEAENARLRRQLAAIDDGEAVPTPEVTPAPHELEKLPPVRYGDKLQKRMKYPPIGGGDTGDNPASHSPSRTPEPTPRPPRITMTPEPTPTPERTPEPTPTPLSNEEKKMRKAQAQEQYEDAMQYPQDSEEALPPLRKAVEFDPENTLYKETLVERLYKTGNFGACARQGELFERGGLQNTTIALYTSSAYTSLKEYDSALEVLNRLLQNEPENGYALFNKGLNLSYLGKTREAQVAFERFLEVAQDKPAFAKWVGDAQNQLRQMREEANQ